MRNWLFSGFHAAFRRASICFFSASVAHLVCTIGPRACFQYWLLPASFSAAAALDENGVLSARLTGEEHEIDFYRSNIFIELDHIYQIIDAVHSQIWLNLGMWRQKRAEILSTLKGGWTKYSLPRSACWISSILEKRCVLLCHTAKRAIAFWQYVCTARVSLMISCDYYYAASRK